MISYTLINEMVSKSLLYRLWPYGQGKFVKSITFRATSFKGQLKRWDKLTPIARFWSPENGFEEIFEKFVFVLEISAVKVEELCGTNSRLSSFSEKILLGEFCLWRHWWSLLSVRSWSSYGTQGFCFLRAGLPESQFWRLLRNIS